MELDQVLDKFYEGNNGRPSICQNIHDSFRVWVVHSSSIKFLTGYYLMTDHKYTKYSEYKI